MASSGGVLSTDRCAGIVRCVCSFERMEEFKYLVTTLTNQNPNQGEVKRRLKAGTACYHSVQNLLSYSLLSQSIKIKIYRTIILPVFVWA